MNAGRFIDQAESFSDQKLSNWVTSALIALFEHEEKKDYVIGFGVGLESKKTKKICIVDVDNTGIILQGSRWQGGVHECLEAKHGLDISREGICPISMSHPVFYQMYQKLFGVTGMIGSESERTELKEIYGMDTFDVPTHNPSNRKDGLITTLSTEKEYLAYLVKSAQTYQAQKRSVLILCHSIQDTEVIAKAFDESHLHYELLNEIQQTKEEEVIKKAGLAGSLTVATNTAGRGTDIKLSSDSIYHGGLHVVLTFYPKSDRTELQAKGRAGRQGEPGSSEMILCLEKMGCYERFKGFSEKECVVMLSSERKMKSKIQKSRHIAHAHLEKTAFQLTQEFYRMLNQFEEHRKKASFSFHLAQFLHMRCFYQPETRDFTHLPPKMQQTAIEILKLFNKRSSQCMEWQAVIGQVVQNAKDYVINEFATNFHSVITQMHQETAIFSSLIESDVLSEIKKNQVFKGTIYHPIIKARHAQIQQQVSEKMQICQEEIKTLFHVQKRKWENYFDPSGQGIIDYISFLVQVNLGKMSSMS